MTDLEYFQYLRKRSRLGRIYRQFWLYPHICKYIRGTALDVGCGIGDLLQYRPNTLGVDINGEMVDWCQQQGLDVKIMKKDTLPFSDQIFDSVIIDNVLEHIEDPALLLSEIHRVTCENGVLIVGVPGKCGYLRDPDHKHFYDERLLVMCLEEAGFNTIKVVHMPFRFFSFFDKKMRQYCLYGIFQRR